MLQALSFIDMGTLLCQASPEQAAGSYSLAQLLVPGLEQRAWHLPPLTGVPASPGGAPRQPAPVLQLELHTGTGAGRACKGSQVSDPAGYFDAPSALACGWDRVASASLPAICLVFCSLEGHAAMKVLLAWSVL